MKDLINAIADLCYYCPVLAGFSLVIVIIAAYLCYNCTKPLEKKH